MKFSARWTAAAGFLLAFSAAAVWAHWPRSPLPPDARADRVIVRKAARSLELYQGTRLLRTYSVALGRNPVGPKQQAGDNRTPEGRYILDYRNDHSAFHKALHISYPSAADAAAARRRNTAPGGQIMIHGLKNGLG